MDPVLPDPGELGPVGVDHGAEAGPLVKVVLTNILGAVGPAVKEAMLRRLVKSS